MRTLFIPLLIVIYLSSCSQNEVVEPVQRTTPGAVGACSDKTPVDAMCTIAPTAVHPTQFAVGYRDVVKKRKKIHVLKEKRDEFYGYLVKKLPPVVRGPNAQWYIVDGHHTTRALAEEGVLTMYVRVRND